METKDKRIPVLEWKTLTQSIQEGAIKYTGGDGSVRNTEATICSTRNSSVHKFITLTGSKRVTERNIFNAEPPDHVKSKERGRLLTVPFKDMSSI